jgi:hypothetical protein
LKLIEEKNAKYMDVRPNQLRRYNEELENKLENTVWTSGCKSWYTQEDGKNIAIWPGFSFRYRARTRAVNPDHYVFTPRDETATVGGHEQNRDPNADRHRRSRFRSLGRAH